MTANAQQWDNEPESAASSEEPLGEEIVTVLSTLRQVEKYAMKRKSLEAILREAAADQEAEGARLSLFDLLCIGIGSTIGSGVFVLTGEVLPVAGPSATISWLLAGLACLLSGLSYMELSARLPTKGSCYVFSYHSLGELSAVIGALCLTLEYGVSAAGVARSWSKCFVSLIGDGELSEYFLTPYSSLIGRKGRAWGTSNGEVAASTGDSHLDWPAAFIMTIAVVIVAMGVNCGKVVINVFTVAKGLLIAFMIIAALVHWNQNIFASPEAFAPRGSAGVIDGATLLFFGFIGFDEVCCLASKAQDPARAVPRAIGGTLLGATLVSGCAQLALSGIAPLTGESTNFGVEFKHLGMAWTGWLASIGEVVLLPLVVFLSFMPQPELTAAMAEDGLLPGKFCAKDKRGTYFYGTLVTGALMILMALMVPFSVLWDVVSLGVLVAFSLTNASLIQLRYRNGGAVRSERMSFLTWGVMFASWVGCYLVWKGYASAELDTSAEAPGSVTCLVLGLLMIILALTMLGLIAFTGQQIDADSTAADIFTVPLVPWLPGLGMIANAFMMATIGWSSHLFFVVLLLVMLAMFMATRHTNTARGRKQEVKDLHELVVARDKRIAELEAELGCLRLRTALSVDV